MECEQRCGIATSRRNVGKVVHKDQRKVSILFSETEHVAGSVIASRLAAGRPATGGVLAVVAAALSSRGVVDGRPDTFVGTVRKSQSLFSAGKEPKRGAPTVTL